jgi:hypothetical protein
MANTHLRLAVKQNTTAAEIASFLNEAAVTKRPSYIRARRQKSSVSGGEGVVVLFVCSGKESRLQRLRHFLFSSAERRLGAKTLLAQLERHADAAQRAAFFGPARRAAGGGTGGEIRRLQAHYAAEFWQRAFPEADNTVKRLDSVSTAVRKSCEDDAVLKTGCDDLVYLAYLRESDVESIRFRLFLGCGQAMSVDEFSRQVHGLDQFLRALRQPAPGTQTTLQLSPYQRALLQHAIAFSHQWMKASYKAERHSGFNKNEADASFNYMQAHAIDMVVNAMIAAFPDELPYKQPPATSEEDAQKAARYKRCTNVARAVPASTRQKAQICVSAYQHTDWVS